jgi:4-hydroxy-tetrahydrodipicolinate synthase
MLRALSIAITTGLLAATALAGKPCKSPGDCCHPWAGIYPTVLTPWNCDCTVDEASLEAQLRYEIAGGVQGVLVLGSLGEGERASPSARAQVLAVTARTVVGCVPFVVGIHTCDVECAKSQLLEAKAAGAAAVLVKYKGDPNACGGTVLAFFQVLSDLNALPILYYHYPSDTGLKLAPADIAAIVCLPNVAGAKISTLDLGEFERIVACAKCCDKTYLSGTSLNLTQFMEAGGHGGMCPEAVLLPAKTECAYRLWCEGLHEAALDAQKELFVLSPVLRGGGFEATARKKVMFTQGHDIRLPMHDYQPQARLKATLSCLGVPTSSKVSCPLPDLNRHDQMLVDEACQKIHERCLR